MTMMEDFECTTCHDKGHIHMCNSEEAIKKKYGVKDCPYCGAKDVGVNHLCKPKIEHLQYVCVNCGRVSIEHDLLCNPVKLSEAQKAKWAEVPTRGTEILKCKNCHQPITPPGHICDRVVPYVCKYCGEEVKNSYHMCKETIGKAKIMCKLCGRLAVEEHEVCAPMRLD